jgi:glycosyltransferase involved in cell wall biosynthesis
MVKVDLHVHSKYSEHPSEWFLQRIGAKESYIDPEFVYKTAKERGMDFVTLTDHNRIDGALILKEKYPHDFFMGVEATTYFPENGCKIHILIYDLNETQFDEIQLIRNNIYDLRDYLKAQKLPHSVAHATYSVNGKLTLELFEKLILLFDIFEGINGGRNKFGNDVVIDCLKSLTPFMIEDLYKKHKIKPFSDTSWIKGFTGGSDDHAGFFIGKTFTTSEASTRVGFINSLSNKETLCSGRHNDYQGLAFAIYKIAYDFSKTKSDKLPTNLISQLNEFIFENKSFSFLNKLKLKKFRSSKKKNKDKLKVLLLELIDELRNRPAISIEDKLDMIYDKISLISDEFLNTIIGSVEHDFKKGNLINAINKVTSSLPGIFLAFPFITTLKHMFQDRGLLDSITNTFIPEKRKTDKKILWFTDTINDLNGVSVTLRKIGWYSLSRGKDIKIITSVSEKEIKSDLPPNMINLPYFYEFKLPNYEKLVLKLPSILNSLKIIYDANPDEIYISSPGPIGLLGVLAAKLLNVKCIGVYHTDFAIQAREITGEESIFNLVDSYAKWFYSVCDKIKVPTKEYINILSERGYESFKMSVFGRGIDSKLFTPIEDAKEKISQKYKIKKGINLVYAGRVSKDKNLDFLVDVYKKVLKQNKHVNLLIVGDGPYYDELRYETRKLDRVYFTGELKTEKLPEIYSGSDLLVFPSITDTFGMSVLESQACGLPAIVSNIGGPKEIIVDGKTGYVSLANSVNDWEKKICNCLNLIEDNPQMFFQMKKEARKNAVSRYDWDNFIDGIVTKETNTEKTKEHKSKEIVA